MFAWVGLIGSGFACLYGLGFVVSATDDEADGNISEAKANMRWILGIILGLIGFVGILHFGDPIFGMTI